MAANHPRESETFRHYEAFEAWYWSQPREYAAVASQYGVTEGAVRKWADKFEWIKRAGERDAKMKARIADRNDGKALAARDKLLRVSETVVARFADRLLTNPQDLAKANATPYEPTATDAVRWGQMQLLLTGQATNRNELTMGRGFVDAFFALMGAVLRKEMPRCCPACKTQLDLGPKIGQAMLEACARLEAQATGGAPPPPAKSILPGARAEDPDSAGDVS